MDKNETKGGGGGIQNPLSNDIIPCKRYNFTNM